MTKPLHYISVVEYIEYVVLRPSGVKPPSSVGVATDKSAFVAKGDWLL